MATGARCSSISPQAPGDSSRLARKTIQKRFPATTSCPAADAARISRTGKPTRHDTPTSDAAPLPEREPARLGTSDGKQAREQSRRGRKARRRSIHDTKTGELEAKRPAMRTATRALAQARTLLASGGGASAVAKDEERERTRSLTAGNGLLREARRRGTPLWISREENVEKA